MSIFRKNLKDRLPAFQNLAVEIGFSQSDAGGLISQLKNMQLFRFGSGRKVENMISNINYESDSFLFDYTYQISTGKSTHIYDQTVLFFDSKSLSLPDFHLKPENFFDMLKEWFGFHDIDFISHLQFSKQYRLTGEYESVIRYYFNQQMLDLLTDYKSFWMEASNYYLIIYKHQELIRPDQLKVFYNFGQMVFELFKLRSQKSKEELGLS